MEELQKQLKDIHDAIAVVRHNQSAQSPHKSVKLGAPFPNYTLTASTLNVLEEFDALVHADTIRFQNAKAEKAAAKETAATTEEGAEGEEAKTTEKDSAPANSNAQLSPFAENFKENFDFDAIDQINVSDISIPGKLDGLEPSVKELCLIIAKEVEFVADNIAELNYTISSMNKLKKVYASTCNNNIMDAVTILRTACGEEPNNKSLPFILSQFYYYLASLGRREILPKASKQAATSAAINDSFDQNKLLIYRYTHTCAVFQHNPEQALQLIRDYALLNPENILADQGISAHDGTHLKSFILLSKISPTLWGKEEVGAIFDLAVKTAGGALIYIHFIRPKIIDAITNETNDALHPLVDLEKSLQKSLHLYTYTSAPMNGNTATGLKMPWLLLNKYQTHFSKICDVPTFDEVLMYISLDGSKYYLDTYPSHIIERSEIRRCAYWYAWANTISPYEDGIEKHYIPFAHLTQEVAILKLFEKLVITLEKIERSLTPQDKWAVIKPYMPNYAYNSFLDVGKKGQTTSGVKNNNDPYFKGIYQEWTENIPGMTAPLPSQIIRSKAMSGTFTTLEEIDTAFKGIADIIVDPVHGLKIRAKQALKKCLNDKSKLDKADSNSIQSTLLMEHLKDFWWLYLVLIPFSIMTFFILMTADNYLQAIKMLSIIMIVIMGIGLVVYYFFKMPKDEAKQENKDS